MITTAVHIKNIDEAKYIDDKGFKPSHPWYDTYRDAFIGLTFFRNDIKDGVFVVYLTENFCFSNTQYMEREKFGKELYTKLISFDEFKKSYDE